MDTWWKGGYYEFIGDEERQYLEAEKNPTIVHFTGPKAFTKECKNRFAKIWWEYAQKTVLIEEFKEIYMNSKLPQIPLKDKIFSIKNEYHNKIKTKYLTILGLKLKIK